MTVPQETSASSPIADQGETSGFWQGTVRVIENVPLARDTYRVRVHCPEIAGKILPGQFVMLRLAGANDPLLGRPLALYETGFETGSSSNRGQDAVSLDLVYLVVGKLTSRLARLTVGAELEIWGPLGHPFVPPAADHLVMVAGGIGQTPFLALAQECLAAVEDLWLSQSSRKARATGDLLLRCPQRGSTGRGGRLSPGGSGCADQYR